MQPIHILNPLVLLKYNLITTLAKATEIYFKAMKAEEGKKQLCDTYVTYISFAACLKSTTQRVKAMGRGWSMTQWYGA